MRILRPDQLPEAATREGTGMLAVGFAAHTIPSDFPVTLAMSFATLCETARELFARSGIDKVTTPLFGEGCDAEVVAQELSRLGFSGLLVVLSPPLPNPRMVEREVRAEAVGFRVQFVGPSNAWLDKPTQPAQPGAESR